jgi:hypothetical protein
MNGLSSLGASGVQASMQAFDRAASGVNGPDLIDSAVSMRVAASDVKANIAVVRTADEMLGTLLDMQA